MPDITEPRDFVAVSVRTGRALVPVPVIRNGRTATVWVHASTG